MFLAEFRNENGHCNVPARYATNRRLGIWVSAQRQQYKVLKAPIDPTKPKRSSPLTQERIDLLDQLGFTWTVRSRESSAPGEALNVAIDAEGKENEEDHLLAAGAMMANFRQHHHQAFVDAGVFDAPEDSVTPI